MMKSRMLLGVVAMSSLLSACVPAVFVAGAAAGGTAAYDRRSMGVMLDDQNILHQTNLALANDPQIVQNTHIIASSFNQIVLLVGQAPTEALRQRAVDDIQKVPNIRRIYNEIAISAPTSSAVQATDNWITTKVRTEMTLAKDLHSSQIKVITENGVVYLMGIVTHAQADIAVDVARHVIGVQRVVKLFEYTNY